MITDNPLYCPEGAPDFDIIRPDHADIIAHIIAENRAEIERLSQLENPDWDTLMQPLARIDNRLAMAFSPINHLHSVNSCESWRAAYEKILPDLSAYETDIAQHTALYNALQRLKAGDAYMALSSARKKVVDDKLADFERSGVALDEEKKAEFKQNSLRLATLSTQFSNHVLDATNAWHRLVDISQLSGVPKSIRVVLADLARQHAQDGYRITLDAPVVTAILTYADDRALREEVYRAYNARASELSDDGKFDNTLVIEEILKLRARQAEILGFTDYASWSVDDKMAKTSQTVLDFLHNLVDKAKAVGELEMRELRAFAQDKMKLDSLEVWDISYVSEKLRQQKYTISQEDFRPYFPISTVIDGLFAITEKLFGVRFARNTQLSVWHEHVQVYDVLDRDNVVCAQFYLDPYARAKKRAGAWMDSAVTRFKDHNQIQIPVAYLVCNFTPPVDGSESYLTHDDVTTLFHEFGHGLHHMLTQVDDYAISGIHGVEWDAVEQPSQFMENFCYDWCCLQLLTKHQKTSQKLPRELFEKLIAAKNFHSAMAMLRQLEFALFDFHLHTSKAKGKNVLAVLQMVQQTVSVTPSYPENRFPMQFSHIFAGGYAAGYYSYKWAEVLSADSFSAFLEEGVLNADTGARFRDEILAVGASRPSIDSFIAFRGRKPMIEPLLIQSGIMPSTV